MDIATIAAPASLLEALARQPDVRLLPFSSLDAARAALEAGTTWHIALVPAGDSAALCDVNPHLPVVAFAAAGTVELAREVARAWRLQSPRH